MKTKYRAIIAICCILLAGCITAAVILLMPNRTTADDGEEFDPADVDKFTVEDKYKDVLEGIKAEMADYYISGIYAGMGEINHYLGVIYDLSITEESIAGKKLYGGHLFADWETNGFDESTLMTLHIKRAIALQYRYYLCELYMNEYKDNAEVKSWLAYRIEELTLLLADVQDAIYENQPPYTGLGGEPGWPETTEPFVPETVIPVTPMPETAMSEE